MHTPRFARNRWVALLAVLLLGLAGPSLARADQFVMKGSKKENNSPAGRRIDRCPEVCPPARKGRVEELIAADEDEESDKPLTEAERLRTLMFLANIMLRSPYGFPPPNNTTPLVVKPPTLHIAGSPTPGGHHPPPQTSPEPASVVSALLGSGFLFAAWLRKRARRQAKVAARESVEWSSVENEAWLAMAA